VAAERRIGGLDGRSLAVAELVHPSAEPSVRRIDVRERPPLVG
jgi:hypothetical protein